MIPWSVSLFLTRVIVKKRGDQAIVNPILRTLVSYDEY